MTELRNWLIAFELVLICIQIISISITIKELVNCMRDIRTGINIHNLTNRNNKETLRSIMF